MDKISPIKERILQFIKIQGVTKLDFCDKVGVSYCNFKGKGLNSEIGGSQICKILYNFPELSADWLLTGRGEMLRDGVASGHNESGTQQIIQGNNNSNNSVTVGQAVAELQKAIEEKDNTIRLQAETIARLSQIIGK